ncbi:ATP-binding protein [Pseudomonas huaxiensis]|uniref:ATP-binding protein n=1 Tax=Pseudomonas huaxiensis TaxID=2213017 RepID=UPI001CDC1A2D|nr:ATP-binding protein [Pseudomonas huaxiensis]
MDVTIAGALTQVLIIEDVSQIGYARRTTQKLAEQLGFNEGDAGRVALVTTELASNLLKHAARGELHVQAVPGKTGVGVEILAIDRAGGFDREACLTDGFSTRGTQGIGLGAISRQAEVFDMYADERGAVLLTRFYAGGQRNADLPFGASQHSLHDDPACGDCWQLVLADNGVSALVIDGLGHGEEAERAALAGRKVFARMPFAAPHDLFQDMHQAMTGSRGGAAAVAQFSAGSDSLCFTGIGNIGASLIAPENYRGLTSHPGIVGVQYRKAQPFDYAHVNGNLLIMYSDGLQSRWNLRDYPGLVHRHPAVIAAVLHRDFSRGRDDATVLVVALEASHG